MSLAIDYCKEIAGELKKTAVYIPGTSVKPGDIIKFSESNIFGTPRPLGQFAIHGNLSDLGIELETVAEDDNSKDSYVYASKGSVNVSFDANAEAGTVGEGKLTIGFSKEGSTYLSAVDCKETRFKTIIGLESKLADHQNALDWPSFFIVISVTEAAKALIMQSNTSSASLEISGSVKNLIPAGASPVNIDASTDLKITKYTEASFIKDWSDNVPVFFILVRYRKKFLGAWDLDSKRISMVRASISDEGKAENPYIIEVIDPANFA
jgi:hypothetical protein